MNQLKKSISINFSLLLLLSTVAYASDTTESAHPLERFNNSENDLSRPFEVDPEFITRMDKTPDGVILALGGGGCKTVAHIGVLRSLEKHHIPIAGVLGTSMGATIGALYCAGVPLKDIERMFINGSVDKAIKSRVVVSTLTHPFTVLLSKLHLRKVYGGLLSGKGLLAWLEKKLPPTFEGLRIPFGAVTTNLTDGHTTVLAKGSLAKSVLASNAFPPYVRPVEIEGKLYVDGGLKANLPAVIAQELSDKVVVGVIVDQSIKPVSNDKLRTRGAIMRRVADIMVAAADRHHARNSDILIYPNCDYIPMVCKNEALLKRGIASGEQEADRLLPAIKQQLVERENAPRIR